MDNLLEVQDLRTHFFTDEGIIKAVDGVSFDIRKNEVLGVVGESGCGKSVLFRSVLRIEQKPGKISSGRILFNKHGETADLAALEKDSPALRSIQGREIAMVFQEPMVSLSPLYTIGNQIAEGILAHGNPGKAAARERAVELLRLVGMNRPEKNVDEYPHQLSGGMRQRVMIAMALSLNPRLLIADEPTTALDVTTQAQILELMASMRGSIQGSIVFITHDLGVIAEITERVIVMYLGRIMEIASTRALFNEPAHPYTRALLQSVPGFGQRKGLKPLFNIKGMIPNPFERPRGCPFFPRCAETEAGLPCEGEAPPRREIAPGHSVSCFKYRGDAA
jgi:peptide/nickel transport system ATP-binding protein